MRHVGLKARMAAVGSILFGFYMLLAIVAVEGFGAPIPLVLLGTVLFAGFQYKFGKWAALRSAGADEMSEDRYPDVHRSVERLCGEMDLAKPDLKVAEMGVPNAFAVGRRGAGVVVVSTELMHLLSHEELEAVLAHELAHIDNRDVVTSRYREYVADDDAARHVGGDAMADALRKISSAGKRTDAELDDNVSALCIFGGERSALERLFATHPPIEKRVEAVRNVEREYY
ncbi:protease [Halobacteriales archaeon QS_9_70_65]|nr:MAG: protease [Halobacteriales archaeon QS_9_70_65]